MKRENPMPLLSLMCLNELEQLIRNRLLGNRIVELV